MPKLIAQAPTLVGGGGDEEDGKDVEEDESPEQLPWWAVRTYGKADKGSLVKAKTEKAAGDVADSVWDEEVVLASKGSKSTVVYVQENMSVKYVSLEPKAKTGKGTYTNDALVVPKTSKSASKSTKASVKAGSLSIEYMSLKPKAKTGKGALMYSNDVTIISKSSKSTKSSKSSVSKASKSLVYMSIHVTPEEAGLPFRSKSSKTIPIRHVYDEE